MIASEGATASVRRARQARAGPAERPIDGPPTTEGQCTRWGPTAGAGNNSKAAVRPTCRAAVSQPALARRVDPAGTTQGRPDFPSADREGERGP